MYEPMYGVLDSAVDMLSWMFSYDWQMFVIFFTILLKKINMRVIGKKDREEGDFRSPQGLKSVCLR